MDWKTEFQSALADIVIKRGSPLREGDDSTLYYGWHDFEAWEHLNECSVASWHDIVEDDWMTFNGTFNDSLHAYGVSLTFTCGCGLLEERKLRYEASFGDILREIVGFPK